MAWASTYEDETNDDGKCQVRDPRLARPKESENEEKCEDAAGDFGGVGVKALGVSKSGGHNSRRR